MPKKSKLLATEISGYTVLPLRLPPLPSFPDPVTHYLYLRPHDPRIPDPDAARSLFLVNIPIDTTETHLRHLFTSQLSAGRVEKVQFEGALGGLTKLATTTTLQDGHSQNKNKKRKRQAPTAIELQTQLETFSLPSTWDRELHASGSHAIVTFVDKSAMEASYKAAKNASKAGSSKNEETTKIIWGEGIEHRLPALGATRYRTHLKLIYPPTDELLATVNEYMATFTEVEATRAAEEARRLQEPDEDGFVTVTRGPRLTDIAREEEVRELVEKQKRREEGLGDFYRFQMREKRKERQNELLRRFDEDKRKIAELKRRKGRIMPEGV
ncbi:ribosomal RNA-processing protein 7-domain-containing protein [Talaromyces proteolyticus]|uniref:Ribosomal RNA-processing protein 7-domain-containing protein n=1 Tax=Talaromyces proteolyticus TaxID=1131652 RepID=A0AAD4KJ85_9EURO|nr:ribosomal RNA-processing protein 7-domain-containing protein [Talaromyces proteolyticus]KAH8692407.1 ribosomal RNA-processing protein 7-domain-containing protein [Talaromyces proteolyticus]